MIVSANWTRDRVWTNSMAQQPPDKPMVDEPMILAVSGCCTDSAERIEWSGVGPRVVNRDRRAGITRFVGHVTRAKKRVNNSLPQPVAPARPALAGATGW